jgi:glycosyl transferase family 17
MRVWDVFMFHSELDILEARLTEVEELDIIHVLVEATVSHKGGPKPLYYADNKSRFDKWNHKIIHVIADDLPGGPNPWEREHAQRDRARKGLKDAEPDDVIIHSDCDELYTENAVRLARNLDAEGYHLRMREFIYAIDWEVNSTIRVAVMTRLRNFSGQSFISVRNRDFPDTPPEAGPMGWHLSSFGGNEGILAKLERHCHTELEGPVMDYMGRMYEKGEFPFGMGRAEPVEINETWPKYVTRGLAPAIWYRPRG